MVIKLGGKIMRLEFDYKKARDKQAGYPDYRSYN